MVFGCLTVVEITILLFDIVTKLQIGPDVDLLGNVVPGSVVVQKDDKPDVAVDDFVEEWEMEDTTESDCDVAMATTSGNVVSFKSVVDPEMADFVEEDSDCFGADGEDAAHGEFSSTESAPLLSERMRKKYSRESDEDDTNVPRNAMDMDDTISSPGLDVFDSESIPQISKQIEPILVANELMKEQSVDVPPTQCPPINSTPTKPVIVPAITKPVKSTKSKPKMEYTTLIAEKAETIDADYVPKGWQPMRFSLVWFCHCVYLDITM